MIGTNHKVTTAQGAQSIQWQRPNLRMVIGPIVFVHGHSKVMDCLAGWEMPDAVTHTW